MISEKSKLHIWLVVIPLALFFAVFSFGGAKSSGLVAPGATLKLVQSGFNGTEGPATDADGNVYFTEVFGSKIDKWTWNIYTLEMTVRGTPTALDLATGKK